MSLGMVLVVCLDLCESSGLTIKVISAVFSFAFGLSIAFSRLFLGVHSLDQVAFGLLIGAWSACFMHFVLKTSIDTEITELVSNTTVNHSKRVFLCFCAQFMVMGS